MGEEILPTPTPERAIEDLRDDGFWPQAMALEILLRESRYHQQEIETLLAAKRRSDEQGKAYRNQREKLRGSLDFMVAQFGIHDCPAVRQALAALEETNNE